MWTTVFVRNVIKYDEYVFLIKQLLGKKNQQDKQ